MSTDNLAFPEITEAAPVAVAASTAVDLRKIDLKDVALAQFGAWRKETADTKAELGKLALDLSTQTRIDEAVSLRHRKINTPLAQARKVSKALKSKLTDVSKSVGAELEAIETAWADVETAITPQIEAAQKKIDDAKEAVRLAEEARLQGLRAQVDDILSRWVDRCKADDITAERIGAGITALQDLDMPPEVADVSAHWTNAKAATLTAMDKLRAQAEAARLEAQRIENERVAAEQRAQAEALAAQQRALAEQAAEIQRQAAELAAQRAESERLERLAAENRARLAEQERRSQEDIDAAKAMAAALQPAAGPAVNPADLAIIPASAESVRTTIAAFEDVLDGFTDPKDTDGEPRDQTPAEIAEANGPEVELPPVVTGSPAAIWLVYGNIDSDCTHAECAEVTWCEDQQHPSDVRYVRADVAEAMVAELRRWKSTHAPRLAALEPLYKAAQIDAEAGREAAATLASERAANALLTDENERLRAALAASCDEHRSQVYDSGPGGGCPLLADAVAAERERWEVVVFDGWRVLKGLDDAAAKRTTHQNVSDTLDALMRVLRA